MLKEEAYFTIVEKIIVFYIHIKKLRMRSMDIDDIAQEIRLKCWTIYHNNQYPENCTEKHLYNFLKSSVHNWFYNKKRGITLPNNPPCNRCPLRDKRKGKCMMMDGADKCDKLGKYWRKLKIKHGLSHPILRSFLFDYEHKDIKAVAYGAKND